MNFTLCVLLVYNDNGSVQNTLHNARFIYLYCYYYFDCALSITVFEIAVLKIQRYAQFMEDPSKNSHARQRLCHHKYKDNFDISLKLIFFDNDSRFQTNQQHKYHEKNDARHYATSPEIRMTSVIRLHSNVPSLLP